MTDVPVYQHVELIDDDGNTQQWDKFCWWESGMAELWGPVVLWAHSPVLPGCIPGAHLRVTHAQYTFDGVVVEPRPIDHERVGLMMKPWEPPAPSTGPAFDPTLMEAE